MNIEKFLIALRDERELINAAIAAIERLTKDSAESPVKRRGRPPGSKNKPKPSATQH